MSERDISFELKTLKKTKGVYAFVIPSKDYSSTCSLIAKRMITKFKLHGIYVSLNKTSDMILADLAKSKVNSNNLYIIDSCGKRTKREANCLHVSNNQSLTELSLAITSALTESNFNFLIFDSISTLLVYNDIDVVERFMHFLINKLKNTETMSVIFSIDEEKSNKLITVISQFCDKVVKV